jgi:hypothetical protein
MRHELTVLSIKGNLSPTHTHEKTGCPGSSKKLAEICSAHVMVTEQNLMGKAITPKQCLNPLRPAALLMGACPAALRGRGDGLAVRPCSSRPGRESASEGPAYAAPAATIPLPASHRYQKVRTVNATDLTIHGHGTVRVCLTLDQREPAGANSHMTGSGGRSPDPTWRLSGSL